MKTNDKTNRIVARIPFCGFYNSPISRMMEEFEDMENEDASEDDFKSFEFNFEEISRYYVDFLNEETKMGIEFESLDSPKEYNFRTDYIFATIPKGLIYKMLSVVNPDDLDAEIREELGSKSGFASFHDEFVERWRDIMPLLWQPVQYHPLFVCYFKTLDFDPEGERLEDYFGAHWIVEGSEKQR